MQKDSVQPEALGLELGSPAAGFPFGEEWCSIGGSTEHRREQELPPEALTGAAQGGLPASQQLPPALRPPLL